MPFKAVINSLDEVAEDVRSHYAPGTDDFAGKFILQVEASNGLQLAPVEKLQSALQSERGLREAAEKKVISIEGSDGNPLSADQIKAAMSELAKLREAGTDDAKKLEALEASLKQQFTEREAQLDAKYKEDYGKQDGLIQSLRGQLHKAVLIKEATDAIVAAGGNPEVLLPHIERQVRAKDVENPDGTTSVKYDVIDVQGNARFGTKPGTSDNMTIGELVGELKENKAFAGCFQSSGASGPGGRSTTQNNNQRPPAPADQQFEDPVERMRQFREQQAGE